MRMAQIARSRRRQAFASIKHAARNPVTNSSMAARPPLSRPGKRPSGGAPNERHVTALVVAVVGVAGTFASAVIAQILSMRSRSRETKAQDNQRREDRDQALQNRKRVEVKTAIVAYLEAGQHLQTQLYAREHGREFEDVALMVEQVWLAHAQV